MQFSIVVPVYNVEKYLEECLDSLVNQNTGDYEIILVDDGSSDSSGFICDEYAKKHRNIKVIHKPNEGLLLARRTGLKQCKGDYILHCDSDDYMSPDALEKLSKVIINTHPDMVMYGYDVVDDEHRILEEHHSVFSNNKEFYDNSKEEILNELASTTWLNNMVTKATKRTCVDIEADYSAYKDIKMGEDLFQVIAIMHNCYSFVYIAEPLYYYRYNPKGMSKIIDISYLDNHIIVSERLNDLLLRETVSDTTKLDFYNRYVMDLYKYLLRFAKIKVTKEEFRTAYNIVNNDSVFMDAEKRANEWSAANKLLRKVVKPSNYALLKTISATVLSSRL